MHAWCIATPMHGIPELMRIMHAYMQPVRTCYVDKFSWCSSYLAVFNHVNKICTRLNLQCMIRIHAASRHAGAYSSIFSGYGEYTIYTKQQRSPVGITIHYYYYWCHTHSYNIIYVFIYDTQTIM